MSEAKVRPGEDGMLGFMVASSLALFFLVSLKNLQL